MKYIKSFEKLNYTPELDQIIKETVIDDVKEILDLNHRYKGEHDLIQTVLNYLGGADYEQYQDNWRNKITDIVDDYLKVVVEQLLTNKPELYLDYKKQIDDSDLQIELPKDLKRQDNVGFLDIKTHGTD